MDATNIIADLERKLEASATAARGGDGSSMYESLQGGGLMDMVRICIYTVVPSVHQVASAITVTAMALMHHNHHTALLYALQYCS